MLLAALTLTEDQRFDAIARRDGSSDGAFFYAVRTTGVYRSEEAHV